MTRFMCVQCGAQFAETSAPPPSCPVCEDERQYVRWSGQEWTTFEELRASHRNAFTDEGGLTGVGIEPSFAIGQRALVVPTGEGPVLWDCVSLVTDEARGGPEGHRDLAPALLFGFGRMERGVRGRAGLSARG
jgi:hypothetical protein